MLSTMSLLERTSITLGKGLLGAPHVQLPSVLPVQCGKAPFLRNGSHARAAVSDPLAASEHGLSGRREQSASLALALSLFVNGLDFQSKKQSSARGCRQVCHAQGSECSTLGGLKQWAKRRRATSLQSRVEVEEWGWGSGSERLETASHVTLATGTPTPSLPFASAR